MSHNERCDIQLHTQEQVQGPKDEIKAPLPGAPSFLIPSLLLVGVETRETFNSDGLPGGNSELSQLTQGTSQATESSW